jgi:hypothetical protein
MCLDLERATLAKRIVVIAISIKIVDILID